MTQSAKDEGARDGAHEGALLHAWHTAEHAAVEMLHAAERALLLPERPRSRWHRAGIGARTERAFDVVASTVLVLFVAGWTISLLGLRRADGMAYTPSAGAAVAAAVTEAPTLSTTYITAMATDLVSRLSGESGKLRVAIDTGGAPLPADSLPAGAAVKYFGADSTRSRDSSGGEVVSTPRSSGIWSLALAIGNAVRPVGNLQVITLTPFSAKRAGRVGGYFVGNWPYERGGKPKTAKYAPPSGFIEVTPENQNTQVSEHFRLKDFLTHDQQGVWPKYLVLHTELVDKLELVLADLAQHGVDVSGVRVMSGFRSPQYNATGGNPAGRAALSRHMYGDASDIFIDSNGDGVMDDLNHDGRVDIRDARVILDAVERVEREHPNLVGGCGVYTPGPGHGPFTHIDVRGYRARWIGTGDS